MFACIFSRTVSKSPSMVAADSEDSSALIDLAFTFSPLVEQTSKDTVVFDISGQDLLFPSSDASSQTAISLRNIANESGKRAAALNLEINVGVAANPDAAIHAARSFAGITIIRPGEESRILGSNSIKKIDHSLVDVERERETEIQDTFALWGIRTFADLARLPLAGVA